MTLLTRFQKGLLLGKEISWIK